MTRHGFDKGVSTKTTSSAKQEQVPRYWIGHVTNSLDLLRGEFEGRFSGVWCWEAICHAAMMAKAPQNGKRILSNITVL